MAKDNRLTKQNYCNFCDHRAKLDGKTICMKQKLPIEKAMKSCEYLVPFDNYISFQTNRK